MLARLRALFFRVSFDKRSLVILLIIILTIPFAVWMALTSQENRQRASDTPVTPPNANGTVQLELWTSEFVSDPENISLNTDPFNVTLFLHAGDYNITGLDFTLNFNEASLPITQFTPSDKFDSVLTNTVNHTNGTFHFVGVATNTSVINSGNVTVGTITVSPKALGTGALTFVFSQITALGFENPIPATYVNKNYVVVAPSPTPIPTAIPTAIPTSTPVPPTPTPIPHPAGDIDENYSVDILDFNYWRDEFLGVIFTKRSDLNKDTKIDLIDFNIWRTEFQKLFDTH